MKGLLIKDLLLMKNKLGQGRILLFILAYILISALVFTDLFFLLNIFLLFILMNTQTHVYVQDQESGFLEFLHITTDLSVRQTVLARFLSSGIFSLGLIVFFFLLFAGFNLLTGLFTWLEMLVIFAVLFVFSLAYILLSMPFLYLFLENGFVILLIFLAILLVLGTTLVDILGPGFIIRLASLPTAFGDPSSTFEPGPLRPVLLALCGNFKQEDERNLKKPAKYFRMKRKNLALAINRNKEVLQLKLDNKSK